MNFSCVYKITSPSGKIYIGQTNRLSRRVIEHKYMSKKSNLKLYNSISKYGIENHKIESIFISDCDYEKDMMEAFYIAYYDSFKNGLNCSRFPGIKNGFLGKKHTAENVLKIKDRMKGITPYTAIEKRKKQVLYNGIVFESISECARNLSISNSHISNMLHGKIENKLNIKFI